MRRLLALVLAGVMVWATIAAQRDNTPPAPPPAAATGSQGQKASAISPSALRKATTQLAALAVKGRAPKTGYSVAQFGPRWSDDVDVELGRDGCDTQGGILHRDMTAITVKAGTRGCVVASGQLLDPYTGETLSYRCGQSPTLVNIDHVISVAATKQSPCTRSPTRERHAVDRRSRSGRGTAEHWTGACRERPHMPNSHAAPGGAPVPG